MSTIDCTDIKVLLSGLIDDEVDHDTRHRAERHLVDCPACRDLISRTETLGRLIVAEARSTEDPDLRDEFIGAVLSRTVYADHPAPNALSVFTNWLGWLAAAAALVLAASIWVMDHRPSPSLRGPGDDVASGPGAPGLAAGHVGPAAYLRSSVLDAALVGPRTPESSESVEATAPASATSAHEAAPTESADGARTAASPAHGAQTNASPAHGAHAAAAPRPALAGGSLITRGDAETFDAVALALDMLLASDDGSFSTVEEIRRIVLYDDLLPRLAEARARMSAIDRTAVFASEAVLLRIVNGPLSGADVQELRDAVRQSDLSSQLTRLSMRWGTMDTL